MENIDWKEAYRNADKIVMRQQNKIDDMAIKLKKMQDALKVVVQGRNSALQVSTFAGVTVMLTEDEYFNIRTLAEKE